MMFRSASTRATVFLRRSADFRSTFTAKTSWVATLRARYTRPKAPREMGFKMSKSRIVISVEGVDAPESERRDKPDEPRPPPVEDESWAARARRRGLRKPPDAREGDERNDPPPDGGFELEFEKGLSSDMIPHRFVWRESRADCMLRSDASFSSTHARTSRSYTSNATNSGTGASGAGDAPLGSSAPSPLVLARNVACSSTAVRDSSSSRRSLASHADTDRSSVYASLCARSASSARRDRQRSASSLLSDSNADRGAFATMADIW
mmetsp:Transcript_13196/g.41584  ORF Transcript_13196/g.41584 Transcript_13196/m.41584 type:complete len:265 (+) Transcript_13196:1716-2510(+)